MSQTNSDSLVAGDACQCGDVSNDGIITSLDVTIVRESLMNQPLSGPFDATRCDVGGSPDCGIEDVFALERHVLGISTSIQNTCSDYLTP